MQYNKESLSQIKSNNFLHHCDMLKAFPCMNKINIRLDSIILLKIDPNLFLKYVFYSSKGEI